MGVKTILTELRNRADSTYKFIVQENEDGTISYGVTDTYGTAAIGATPNGAHAAEHAAMGVPAAGDLPFAAGRSGVPVVLCPSGTFNGTGQLTLDTALPYQPAGTVYVYLFAGNGLTAGLYQATFSSTSVLQLAGSPTTTPGAYAGGTSAVTLATMTIAGGALGANGALRYHHQWTIRNNANNKTLAAKFGATEVATIILTTTTGYRGFNTVFNAGSEAVQVCSNNGSGSQGIGSQTGVVLHPTIDTAQAFSFSFTGQLANAADYIILDSYLVEVVPGN